MALRRLVFFNFYSHPICAKVPSSCDVALFAFRRPIFDALPHAGIQTAVLSPAKQLLDIRCHPVPASVCLSVQCVAAFFHSLTPLMGVQPDSKLPLSPGRSPSSWFLPPWQKSFWLFFLPLSIRRQQQAGKEKKKSTMRWPPLTMWHRRFLHQ